MSRRQLEETPNLDRSCHKGNDSTCRLVSAALVAVDKASKRKHGADTARTGHIKVRKDHKVGDVDSINFNCFDSHPRRTISESDKSKIT